MMSQEKKSGKSGEAPCLVRMCSNGFWGCDVATCRRGKSGGFPNHNGIHNPKKNTVLLLIPIMVSVQVSDTFCTFFLNCLSKTQNVKSDEI